MSLVTSAAPVNYDNNNNNENNQNRSIPKKNQTYKNKDTNRKIRLGDKPFQTKIDKNALIRGDLSAIKVGGFTALKNVQRQSSDGAALTRARKLLNKDVSQLEHVIQKSFEIELGIY